MTNRKRAEAEKKELVAKLERSKKMEAVGLLAGGVAHDLNNILSGIVSYPDLLLMDATLTDKQRHAIETMQRSGLRAAAVVSDLLTLARGAATVRKTMDLNDVVAEYLDSPEFRDVQEKHPHMTLTAALGHDLPPISGSVIHIRKSLMNLVLNAAEALDEAGAVTIATARRIVETPIWNYDRVPPGEYVVLTVSDDGPGIDPKDLERIFEPFYTKKVMGRSGSGLGLTVVWNTVKDHGGYLVLENGETGAAFHLFFPPRFEAVAETAALTPETDIQGRGETVLVVDDEAHQREIASEILASLGYRPTTATGGEEAVRLVEEAPYDLVMLDMIMDPGMNGDEAYERIAAIRPDQRVVIASGFAETEDVKTIQKAGTGTFVKKPYTREKLGAAIRAELSLASE